VNTTPSEQSALSVSIEATERLLSDVETYVDWLYSQTIGVKPEHCRIGYVPRDELRFEAFVESLDVAQLVALQLYPRAEVSFAATEALKEKFLAANQHLVPRIAERVVGEHA
jgi:hypothetical protein